MMTREERAEGLFNKSYNCAQAVLGVFCEDMVLDSCVGHEWRAKACFCIPRRPAGEQVLYLAAW